MKENPLVSAIIPTCKRPEMLVRAVRSVLEQTYPNIELIIVNDGGEDAIEKYLKKEIDLQTYHVIRNDRRAGGSGARNAGFFASKGEFIGFLDDDDEWMPEKITKQVDMFNRNDEKVGIVCASYIIVHNSLKFVKYVDLEGYVYKTLCKEHIVGNTSVPLMKRYAFEQAGLFDEGMPAAQDTELWLRVAKEHHFSTVKEPLAIIHWHDFERITANSSKQILGLYKLLCKHWSDLHPRRKYRLIKRIIRLYVSSIGEQIRS